MIQFRCNGCQSAFNVSADKQGKKAKCPKCGEITQIPPADASVSATASSAAPNVVAPIVMPAGPGALNRNADSLGLAAAAATAEKPVPEAPPKRKRNDQERRDEVMGAFKGEFERPEVKPTYVASAAIVSVVMVALPMVYLAIIGTLACGVGLYVGLSAIAWYESADSWNHPNHDYFVTIVRGILFVIPPVIVCTAIFFLIKPLFARPAYIHRTRSLTEKSDPLLFEFVYKICELVGAPYPTRIDVDDQMNASARFRSGLWSVIRGNDLVLTIGVPLAAGLTTRQFAGVLAHEFGHFSQGAGMRLTYIVRSISHWFARVSYERDEYDAWLWHIARTSDFRIGILVFLFMFFIWIVRTILWILMHVGNVASSFLLRQMEYDADQYEIRLAGSAAFQQTSHRMRMVNAAYGLTVDLLSAVFQQGAMVDDITAFLKVQLQHMPEEVKQEVRTSMEKERTGFFDTHPCDRDRIAAAIEARAPGVFHYEGLAVNLFDDFEQLSKNVTWDRYCQLTGNRVPPESLIPYRQLIEQYKLDIFGKHAKENMSKDELIAMQRELGHPVKIPFDD
ncbi:M48 family metalloprotease [Blastopirellula sp. JC732]|uniref:M48 family metalloprotease n=1 Tax=Blastopirellula sediminis TaxID=2894196 RepID=A0A9X1MLL2_9BACT|nr:M48 family metalloprotease [Blastopirellula sediminis]MCC9609076.1 M48 family metalloprotease [Blastopirellula sediminis]MCC9628147.1 M48 family metalloprotease [Blastopirellula sediminis]